MVNSLFDEFSGSNSKPVPENWADEFKIYQERQQQFFDERREATGSSVNPIENSNPLGWPTYKQYFSYLKTVIAVPLIADALVRRDIRLENWATHNYDPDKFDPDGGDTLDSINISKFRGWWAMQYVTENFDLHSKVSGRLELAHTAAVIIIRGQSPKNGYFELKQKLKTLGQWPDMAD